MAYRFVLALAAALLVAGCHKAQEENVEAQAANASRDLQERYNALAAEAENGADAAAAPYDNEADALLNQMSANAARATGAIVVSPPTAPPPVSGARPRR
ncbi:MAG: hypothetical protein JO013_10430 [Alphaproteobacteria bacterium]|nr:hypothetical protein [Alphaproteobacteria bacterium]